MVYVMCRSIRKCSCLVGFPVASAVQSIPVGQGVVVACLSIVAAFGQLAGNVHIVLVPFPVKNVLAIGPQRPKGSIANGNYTMFLSKSS
jgi:hypothetical protein